MTKLKNIFDKNLENKIYVEILNKVMKLIRQMSTAIIANPTCALEIIQCLITFFDNIFPFLSELRQDDYIIINDVVILFIRVIKTVCDYNIIKNVINVFINLIHSKKKEIIQNQYKDIVISAFYALDHYNNQIINSFNQFCYEYIQFDKSKFMVTLKEILYSDDFDFLCEKYKNLVYNQFDFYSNDINRLKDITTDLMNIAKKIYS